MSYLAALLILVSAAAAQVAPRQLTDKPTTRQIEYHAIRVSNRGETSPADCGEFTVPEAKDTPNPILTTDSNVMVDLVVAWDGLVYSPIIEEDSGRNEAAVIRTVKSWRFRPALCNGSPIATEVRVKFHR
jgi:Gram-negative bacterial TonB protein C-terminal